MCRDTSSKTYWLAGHALGLFFMLPGGHKGHDHKAHGICCYWHPVFDFYFSVMPPLRFSICAAPQAEDALDLPHLGPYKRPLAAGWRNHCLIQGLSQSFGFTST